jgi:hypothetical protein
MLKESHSYLQFGSVLVQITCVLNFLFLQHELIYSKVRQPK